MPRRFEHFARTPVINPAAPPSPGTPPLCSASDIAADLDALDAEGWEYVGPLQNRFSYRDARSEQIETAGQHWLIFRREIKDAE